MAKDWMSKLRKLDGALLDRGDVHQTVIQTKSPSLNFLFGNGWGLPKAHSIILFGPPKSGKSVVGYEFAGTLHQQYPEDYVVRFDTEYRDQAQLTPKMATAYGIDFNRYMAIQTNHPKHIYDQMGTKIEAMCKDGFPLGLVILDSMSGVRGRRSIDEPADVMKQQIGDVAQTNKEGLKIILDMQRRYRFGLIMTAHVAIEMDQIEVKRGNKWKMGASVGVQHHAEYFMYIERNFNKDAKSDLLGHELAQSGLKDMGGKSEGVAHKIKAVMKDSSMGPKGRAAQFTFSYDRGVINQWEELYTLGVNRRIISKPNQLTYELPIPGGTHKGSDNFLRWFSADKTAQDYVLNELRQQDIRGISSVFDAKDEEINAATSDESWTKEAESEEVTAE